MPRTRVIAEAVVAAIPDIDVTASQWAARYRYLSELSSMPGRWRNEVTPYLVEPMDCIGQAGIYEIVFVASSQVGKTEFCCNGLG
ncbi:MAG TPA: phage terminase large subunit family protein, partial [Pyrinomonadaceae bacterium]